MSTADKNAELAKTVLDKFYRSFLERNPQLHVYSTHLHMDEATPHLHIDFIPFTTGNKRGLPIICNQQSDLDWLIYNAPLEYVDLILNGDPEKYR